MLTKTLTLTRGQFFSGAIVRIPMSRILAYLLLHASENFILTNLFFYSAWILDIYITSSMLNNALHSLSTIQLSAAGLFKYV